MIRYILVADSHLPDEPAGTEEFFSMLDSLARFASSFEKEKRPSLVFLGDIFELWIALPGYEKESHRRFLDWCGRHREEFPVLFIEGNHEFFVSFLHRKSFTFCTANRIRENDTVEYWNWTRLAEYISAISKSMFAIRPTVTIAYVPRWEATING